MVTIVIEYISATLAKYLFDYFKIAFTLLISHNMNEQLALKGDQTKVKLFFEEGQTICHTR